MVLAAAIAGIGIVPAAPAAAAGNAQAFYYVSTTGSNANACTSAASPCLTIDGAMALVNATAPTSTDVVINIDSGHYEGSSTIGLADSSNTLTLDGGRAGDTILDASTSANTVLTIGGAAPVTITGLTVTGGHAADGTAATNPGDTGGAGSNGGGISSTVPLTVEASTISGNGAGVGGAGAAGPNGSSGDYVGTDGGNGGSGGSGGSGGGIYAAAALTVRGSTVSGNSAGAPGPGGNGGRGGNAGTGISGNGGDGGVGGTAGNGGGIFVNGPLVVQNSTIAGNTAAANGGAGGNGGQAGFRADAGNGGNGGIGASGGGIYVNGPGAITIQSSTISGNSGGGNGGTGGSGGSPSPTTYPYGHDGATGYSGSGGGLENAGGRTGTITGSILAGLADGSGTNTPNNCAGPHLTDGGHNVEDALSCGFTTTSGSLPGQTDASIGLAALDANGSSGPATQAITSTSVAFELVPQADCPDTDERTLPRPGFAGQNCDAGAFELQAVLAATTTVATPASVTYSSAAQTVTLRANVTSSAGVVGTGTVTFTLVDVSTDVGTPTTSAQVAAGSASVDYVIPAGTATGTYTIYAVYNPGPDWESSADNTQLLTIAVADQSPLTITSTSGSYGTPLTLTTSGGSGTGSVTYSVVDGTASGCAITGGKLTSTSAGTCVVTATKAADTNHNATTSPDTTITIAAVDQSPLTITSTSGSYGTALTLTTSGGSGTGTVTYSVVDGTASGCAITGGKLTSTSTGTCVVTATKAADTNHNATTSPHTTITIAAVAPGAPTGVTGVAGNGQVTVSWVAPTNDGGAAVTHYTVTAAPGYETCVATDALSCTVTGLTNGTSYTFAVTATNTAGTGPASTSSASATPMSPLSADQAYVTALYQDFLGRSPDQTGFDYWTSLLTSGASHATVSAAFSRSIEARRWFVKTQYVEILGRTADPGGLDYWAGRLQAGTLSTTGVSASLYASSEFYRAAGSNDDAWLRALYVSVLGPDRSPSATAASYWTQQIRQFGRTAVAGKIITSPEATDDAVDTLYLQLLGRTPDPQGLVYWAGQIRQSGVLGTTAAISSSSEYTVHAQQRFS